MWVLGERFPVLGPLEKQSVLLPAEPSLQPHDTCHRFVFNINYDPGKNTLQVTEVNTHIYANADIHTEPSLHLKTRNVAFCLIVKNYMSVEGITVYSNI